MFMTTVICKRMVPRPTLKTRINRPLCRLQPSMQRCLPHRNQCSPLWKGSRRCHPQEPAHHLLRTSLLFRPHPPTRSAEVTRRVRLSTQQQEPQLTLRGPTTLPSTLRLSRLSSLPRRRRALSVPVKTVLESIPCVSPVTRLPWKSSSPSRLPNMRGARILQLASADVPSTALCVQGLSDVGRPGALDITAAVALTLRLAKRTLHFPMAMMLLFAVAAFRASLAWAVCALLPTVLLALSARSDPRGNASPRTALITRLPLSAKMAVSSGVNLRISGRSNLPQAAHPLWLLSSQVRRRQLRLLKGARRRCSCFPAPKSARPCSCNGGLRT